MLNLDLINITVTGIGNVNGLICKLPENFRPKYSTYLRFQQHLVLNGVLTSILTTINPVGDFYVSNIQESTLPFTATISNTITYI